VSLSWLCAYLDDTEPTGVTKCLSCAVFPAVSFTSIRTVPEPAAVGVPERTRLLFESILRARPGGNCDGEEASTLGVYGGTPPLTAPSGEDPATPCVKDALPLVGVIASEEPTGLTTRERVN
jgi:hypothetical protein